MMLTGLTGLRGGGHEQVPDAGVWTCAGHAAARTPPHCRASSPRYFAFLSYSHTGRGTADWLHGNWRISRFPPRSPARLTANGVIPKRLTPIFRDRHELAAADDLGDEITAALEASQFLIVLCSPSAAKSRWTNAEIEAFKRTAPGGLRACGDRRGEPFASDMPGREARGMLPAGAPPNMTGAAGRPASAQSRSPLTFARDGTAAASASSSWSRECSASGSTISSSARDAPAAAAGDLAGASLAGMAVTSTLAVTAIQARDAARDQRREAEGLVAFMLGDLKDKLEPIGRLDALDGVGSRVLAYYQQAGHERAFRLSSRATRQALSLTAQVAYLRGNYDSAHAPLPRSYGGHGRGIRRSPGDPQRLFDHAQNVFWLGELARKRGQMGEAETAYREYKRLADRMVAANRTISNGGWKWPMPPRISASS